MNHPRISRLWGHLPPAPFFFVFFVFPTASYVYTFLTSAVLFGGCCQSVWEECLSSLLPTTTTPLPYYRLLLPRTLRRRISETVMAWAIFKKIRRRDERDICKRVRSGYIIRETTAQPSHHPEKPTNQNLSLSLLSTTDVDTRHFFSHSLSSCRAVRVNACHISRFASVLVQLVQRVAAVTVLRQQNVGSFPVGKSPEQTEIDWKKKKKNNYRIGYS